MLLVSAKKIQMLYSHCVIDIRFVGFSTKLDFPAKWSLGIGNMWHVTVILDTNLWHGQFDVDELFLVERVCKDTWL